MFFLWMQHNLPELVTEVQPLKSAPRPVHSCAVQWALRMTRRLGFGLTELLFVCHSRMPSTFRLVGRSRRVLRLRKQD